MRTRVSLPIILLAIAFCLPADAQSRRAPRTRESEPTARTPRSTKSTQPMATGPQDYRSRNFSVHTDLSPDEAQDLLKRLEEMLGIISKYWGEPNRETIECYVVKDLANWPPGSLNPRGVQHIRDGGGITLTTVTTLNGVKAHAKAVVYAAADHGTPQHEAVHAYCGQNFGETGPTWYSEGMAEMGNYWRTDDPSVQLPEGVLRYLQGSDPKPLPAIVDNTDQTGDSWRNYAWRWALCHLLTNNPNYAPRFRPLGLNLILGKPDSFERTYGAMEKEIAFEYRFFLDHMENGLRADLVAWDWKAVFKPAAKGRPLAATIQANHGWQPSRLRVEEGKSYQVAATGNWKTAKDGSDLTADGDDAGKGKLVAAVFDPPTYTLSEPFDLGSNTTFTAPADGNLYLRCNDDWAALADNSGKVAVKLTLTGE
jgi:hypothetical protein